ncbi:MAG: aryl-alcohol dehydrogenase [Actinomycetota bacterium]|nr:aryl-alcohol dehydrogenase [Actinomycetota bacterium]
MRSARAAVVEGAGAPFAVQEIDLDGPREDEVLVELVASGMCHTDLGIQASGVPFPLPGVLGHEGAGIVLEAGSAVRGVKAGDKVLASFTSCGTCDGCAAGRPSYCRTWLRRNLFAGRRDDGTSPLHRDGVPIGGHFFGQSSFADHAVMDARSVVPVPHDTDLSLLAPLGCAVMTGFGAVRNVLRVTPGRAVAVLGTGAVGLSGIIAAALAGADPLIAIDILPQRLDLARELGATHAVDAGTEPVGDRLAEITHGAGLDLAFDTTGVPRVMRTVLDALGTGGTLATCAAPPPGTELPVDVAGILVGKTVTGITMGAADPQVMIPQLVALHEEGQLPMVRLVRHYPLADIGRAASDMRAGRTVKPVILLG